jgi:hypothetical protein
MVELDEDGEPIKVVVDPNYVETDVTKMKCWGKIQNQHIPHILITPTFRCAMLCYSFLAILFAAFGMICLTSASTNSDLLIRYDDKCNNVKTCQVTFTPTVDLKSPKLYY